MHHCLNIVTEPAQRPAALLVRAVEPLGGLEAMRLARRARASGGSGPASGSSPPPDARIAAGPGLVCAAFSIDRSHTGLDLLDRASPLRIERAPEGEPAPDVRTTPRIGIGYAGEPWTAVPRRFVVPSSASLSRRA
jgi:DNA-3-methyladenine glycosylase